MELRIRAVHQPLDLSLVPARQSLAEVTKLDVTETENLFREVDWNQLTRNLWTVERYIQEVWQRWPTKNWLAWADPRVPEVLQHFHPVEWGLDKDFLLTLPLGKQRMIPDGSLVAWYDWPENLRTTTCDVCGIWLRIYFPAEDPRRLCPACQKAKRLLLDSELLLPQPEEGGEGFRSRVVGELYLLLEQEVILYREAQQREWRREWGVTGDLLPPSFLDEFPQTVRSRENLWPAPLSEPTPTPSWSPPWWRSR